MFYFRKKTHTKVYWLPLPSFWSHLLSWFMVQTIEASLRAAAARPAELSRHSSLTSLITKRHSELTELWDAVCWTPVRHGASSYIQRWASDPLQPLNCTFRTSCHCPRALTRIKQTFFFLLSGLFFVVALYLLIKSHQFKWPQWEPWSSP